VSYLVLGAGTIGEAVAWDLTHMSPTAVVTVADRSADALARLARHLPVETVAFNAAQPDTVRALASGHDVVVGALPSRLGFGVMRALCEAGARYCDVSFIPEDAATLDALARRHGAVVVHDCGVAPGLSHVLVGEAVAQMARVDTVRIDVGGLPESPAPPFYYKAPFAPADVIEEYTRPARVVRDGQPVAVEALSGVETVQVEGIGRLDSFLTDGLRSLVTTVAARAMEERTLRHPGHLPLMVALRDAGFFATSALDVGGTSVTPREVTSRLLFPHWTYADGERDVTVLRVEVMGIDRSGAPNTRRWLLVDRPDAERTGRLSSMARTTAFPAAIVARWLGDGVVREPGAHPPESLGMHGLVAPMLEALRHRGVCVETL
jgi:saccharopine dehydrogenase-like NADP-dependent oxidoreductase